MPGFGDIQPPPPPVLPKCGPKLKKICMLLHASSMVLNSFFEETNLDHDIRGGVLTEMDPMKAFALQNLKRKKREKQHASGSAPVHLQVVVHSCFSEN